MLVFGNIDINLECRLLRYCYRLVDLNYLSHFKYIKERIKYKYLLTRVIIT